MVLLLYRDSLTFDWFTVVGFILFPVLGYLTKKGSKKAVMALMAFYIIDRVTFFIYWGRQATQELQLLIPFVISFILWGYFYRAYLVIKKRS